jgi:hypothetical protein
LRQAYDYWQDQPGNYFPTHFRGHRLLACVKNTRFRDVEFVNTTHIYLDPPQLKVAFPRGTTNLEPTSGATSFPTLTCLKQDPPLLQGAEVTAFDEGYPTTGPPKRHAQSWRILKGFDCIRFDHRQAFHLLQQRSKAHPTKDELETFIANWHTNPHRGQLLFESASPTFLAGLFDTT